MVTIRLAAGLDGDQAGATGIEWVHRLSAFILSILVVGLSMLALLFERRRPVLLRLTLASLGTVLAQGLLGGLVVRSDLSVGIVLAHLALATALFALLLVVVVLANLREIPRRWLNWARQASRETEPRNAEDAQRAPRPMETPALSTSLPLRVSPGSVGPD